MANITQEPVARQPLLIGMVHRRAARAAVSQRYEGQSKALLQQRSAVRETQPSETHVPFGGPVDLRLLSFYMAVPSVSRMEGGYLGDRAEYMFQCVVHAELADQPSQRRLCARVESKLFETSGGYGDGLWERLVVLSVFFGRVELSD